MYSRPTSKETDNDLLRLQEEFNRQQSQNQVKLAATVVSQKREAPPPTNADSSVTDIQDQLANTFEAIPEQKNLGSIVEKTPTNQAFPALHFNANRGFPKPKRRDASAETSKGGGSIFAKQFKRVKRADDPEPVQESRLPNQSFVVTGNEKEMIHAENIEKLKSMTEREILEEREKLISTMDPALIAFLKSKRSEQKVETRNLTIQEQNQAAESMEIEEIGATTEILNQPRAEKWLNFKTVETSKLAWMKEVEVPRIDKSKSFEARFDFEGWVLPYTEKEITEKSRVLYHHGEEAGRPGYTLQELFQLARSNVMQQKIVALNTIANILSLQSIGVYDDIIDIPIEQIFFVLRFCLDDNTPAVLNSSIKAMRNLFYSKIDETCLDSLLGFGLGQIQPVLAIDNDPEDDDRVNDQQLAETNLVKCLARTEILIRIRYIINTVRPGIETVVYCLDILTRLARDSHLILTKVWKCEDLISSIINNFINGSTPLLHAVKFLRILASRSRTIAADLVGKYRVMDAILSHLSNDNYRKNTNGLKLQTESFHLWSVFLRYGLATDCFQVFEPVLLEMLNYHLKNTDLDMSTTYVRQGHVSALLLLIGATPTATPFSPILQSCVVKWCKQFMTLTEFACGKLQIMAAALCCFSADNNLILELVNSQGFRIVAETVTNGSMLLNNYKVLRSSPNMRSLGAAAWHASEHVAPLLQTNSPIPFLAAFSTYVEACGDTNVKLAFLSQVSVANYINLLRKLDRYYLTGNWFTRVESKLVMNILKISVSVTGLDTRPFYEVAVKCLSIFTAEQKPNIEYVLKNVVFSKEFYPSEVLMGNLSIEQTSDSLGSSLNEILEVYTQVLGLKIDVPMFTTNLCLDLGKGNVIPVDWIYTPIIVLYSNQQQNKRNVAENQQIFIIRNCLRWILIYETYFPELAAAINATDRFCRIACVFLGSDNLFLNAEIHNSLRSCLINVVKSGSEIDFNKEIQGLTSFQDFYTQLLEQYQGVSYGDVLFGNFILLPLAQRHSVKWRKTLWSEYLGVVEIFNVTEEQSVCPLEVFLSPGEEDLSLLKCYRRALVNNSVRKHSILYTIAKYHVEQYIANKRNKR